MALLASLREPAGHVVGVRRFLESSKVARRTLRGSPNVAAAHVALGTLHGGVCTRKWKCRLGVVKLSIAPGRRVMALHARLRNPCHGVVRIGRLLKVGQMAGNALRGQSGKLAAGMALRALRVHVRARQRELRHGVVVKLCVQPARGAVAGGALLRKARSLVVRVLCAVEVRQVAAHAVGAGGGEIIVGMARRALQPGMRAGKRKAGKFRVVEFRS